VYSPHSKSRGWVTEVNIGTTNPLCHGNGKRGGGERNEKENGGQNRRTKQTAKTQKDKDTKEIYTKVTKTRNTIKKYTLTV